MHGQDGAGKNPLVLAAAAPLGPCRGARDKIISNLSHHRSFKTLFACAVRVLQGCAAQWDSTCSTH